MGKNNAWPKKNVNYIDLKIATLIHLLNIKRINVRHKELNECQKE